MPIIYSMFEFTKEEQAKLLDARKAYNVDKLGQDVKDKSKTMFGKMFNNNPKKKGDSSRGNSGRNESYTDGK